MVLTQQQRSSMTETSVGSCITLASGQTISSEHCVCRLGKGSFMVRGRMHERNGGRRFWAAELSSPPGQAVERSMFDISKCQCFLQSVLVVVLFVFILIRLPRYVDAPLLKAMLLLGLLSIASSFESVRLQFCCGIQSFAQFPDHQADHKSSHSVQVAMLRGVCSQPIRTRTTANTTTFSPQHNTNITHNTNLCHPLSTFFFVESYG